MNEKNAALVRSLRLSSERSFWTQVAALRIAEGLMAKAAKVIEAQDTEIQKLEMALAELNRFVARAHEKASNLL